ncbi:MAG: hypothetical protein ACI85G_001054, partial [Psychroserpens sp.]
CCQLIILTQLIGYQASELVVTSGDYYFHPCDIKITIKLEINDVDCSIKKSNGWVC